MNETLWSEEDNTNLVYVNDILDVALSFTTTEDTNSDNTLVINC